MAVIRARTGLLHLQHGFLRTPPRHAKNLDGRFADLLSFPGAAVSSSSPPEKVRLSAVVEDLHDAWDLLDGLRQAEDPHGVPDVAGAEMLEGRDRDHLGDVLGCALAHHEDAGGDREELLRRIRSDAQPPAEPAQEFRGQHGLVVRGREDPRLEADAVVAPIQRLDEDPRLHDRQQDGVVPPVALVQLVDDEDVGLVLHQHLAKTRLARRRAERVPGGPYAFQLKGEQCLGARRGPMEELVDGTLACQRPPKDLLDVVEAHDRFEQVVRQVDPRGFLERPPLPRLRDDLLEQGDARDEALALEALHRPGPDLRHLPALDLVHEGEELVDVRVRGVVQQRVATNGTRLAPEQLPLAVVHDLAARDETLGLQRKPQLVRIDVRELLLYEGQDDVVGYLRERPCEFDHLVEDFMVQYFTTRKGHEAGSDPAMPSFSARAHASVHAASSCTRSVGSYVPSGFCRRMPSSTKIRTSLGSALSISFGVQRHAFIRLRSSVIKLSGGSALLSPLPSFNITTRKKRPVRPQRGIARSISLVAQSAERSGTCRASPHPNRSAAGSPSQATGRASIV